MKLSSLLVLVFFSLGTATPAPAKYRPHRAAFTPSEQQTLRRILEFEDQRAAGIKLFRDSLFHPSHKVVQAALIAIGRTGDTTAYEEINRLLNKSDRDTKRTAAFALGLIGGETSLKFLTQHLQIQRDPEVRAAILVAIGRIGNEQNVNMFANELAAESNYQLLEGAAHGLGILWTQDSEKWGVTPNLFSRLLKLAQGNDPAGVAAAFAIARYKGDVANIPTVELVETITKTPSSYSKAFLCRAMGRIKSPIATQTLLNQFTVSPHLAVRVESVKALANQEATDALVANLGKALLSEPSAGVLVATLDTLGSFGGKSLNQSDAIDTLLRTSSSAWIKGTALKTLARINPAKARPRVMESLGLPSLLPYAVNALGLMATPTDLEKLTQYLNHSDPRVVEEAVDSLSALPEENFPAPVKNIALKKALERADVGISTLIAQIVEKYKWKEYAQPLATVYRLFTSRDQLEAKVAILNSLAVVGDHSHLELLQGALNDPDKLVVVAAVNAIKAISGKDESTKIPLNSRIGLPTPSPRELQDAVGSKITFKTSRGEIQFKMVDEAPLTAANFVKLAKTGFFKGKTFHRVVSNFVVQGGDPRADGYGGPGYLIRDEVSMLHHNRGTVGVATAGKDTGGCQFFYNLSPNPHLDGKYTIFAEVSKGIEVLDKLEIGDQILSVRVN